MVQAEVRRNRRSSESHVIIHVGWQVRMAKRLSADFMLQ